MIEKISRLVFLIILPILLTMGYLGSGEKNVVGILILAMLCIAFFCTAVTKTPRWGALFLIMALHWFQVEGLSYTLYLMLLATFAYAMYMLRKGDLNLDKAWFMVVISQLGFVMIVYGLKPYPVNTIFFYLNLTALCFFLGSSLVRWDSSRMQALLTAHISYMVIWAFVERAISNETRVSGASFSATNFAVLLVVSWTIWFINGLLCKKTHLFWLCTMTFLVFVSILFSGTRMGLIGMCLGGLLCVLSRQLILQRDRVIKLLTHFALFSAVLVVLVVVVWNMLPDDLFLKQGLQTLLSGKLDPSSLGRIAAWYTAITIIQAQPVWGAGPGNFLIYNIELLENLSFLPMVDQIPRLGHAHNLFLMILAEYGCVGAGFLMIVCGICLKRLLSYIRRAWDGFGLAIFCGGIVMLFLGLFDVFPLYPSSLGWGTWFMSVMFSLRGKEPKV